MMERLKVALILERRPLLNLLWQPLQPLHVYAIKKTEPTNKEN